MNVSHYYVDEAGDPNLFGKRGRVLLGCAGVSRVFMVGVVYLPKPQLAQEYLQSLREDLLADPYFRGVPSMQPHAGKTALAFHACKDLPEVRREMFALLPRLGAKVQVAVRRKAALVQHARTLQARGRKLTADDLYDDLVKRLFKNLLHKADENRILFAHRGKRNRAEALRNAIQKAKANFERSHGKPSDRPTDVASASPHDHAGLQVIDYYLWALQRFYEKGEDRFANLVEKDYRLIMDLDDNRNQPYGEWYTERNPLRLEKMKPVAG